jgi:hypothetical protein
VGRAHERSVRHSDDATTLPAREDLSLLPPPSFVARRDLPPASGRSFKDGSTSTRESLPQLAEGRVGRSHPRHFRSQREGTSPSYLC